MEIGKFIEKKSILVISLIAIALIWLLYVFSPAFAMWGEALCVLSGFMVVIYVVDTYGMPNVNLIKELVNEKNIAVAIAIASLLIAFSVIIHGFATR